MWRNTCIDWSIQSTYQCVLDLPVVATTKIHIVFFFRPDWGIPQETEETGCGRREQCHVCPVPRLGYIYIYHLYVMNKYMSILNFIWVFECVWLVLTDMGVFEWFIHFISVFKCVRTVRPDMVVFHTDE